jgi:ATP-binding cassette subfamily F protein 3
MASTSPLDGIVEQQLESLDDTDCYATAWALVDSNASGKWGGRGQGGRSLARRTKQPYDVVVDDVTLAYVGGTSGSSCLLLDNAQLKLLSGHAYALIGRNGSGKSSLQRRIAARKIPGFPNVKVLYIPQELLWCDQAYTPLEYMLQAYRAHDRSSKESVQLEIQRLEDMIDLLDITKEQDHQQLEELGGRLSLLEEQMLDEIDSNLQQTIEEALNFMAVPSESWHSQIQILSPGLQKKVMLAVALVCPCNLLILDEPTNHLDVEGLLQLRRLVSFVTAATNDSGHPATVLMTSHDLDLINDVATDVIELTNAKLFYYPGNYSDYTFYKHQNDLHSLRQVAALDKKRDAMAKTLDNLKKQAALKRGGEKKKGKQIESHRKKMEREGINLDSKGHRWTAQNTGSGIKVGSINSLDATTRRGLTTQELLKLTQTSLSPPPDKAVQFVFRNPSSEWGEPLIRAMDVGHGYKVSTTNKGRSAATFNPLQTQESLMFDCVELCISERGRYCILGASASGKSVLLRLLAKIEDPLEGTIHHASNLDIGYMDQRAVDRLLESGNDGLNTLSFLSAQFPTKSEQELRGELSLFGLSPKQVTTSIRFMSGGERKRLCLAVIMLRNPPVLFLDQPTSDLDMESVEALIHGLKNWSGTLVTATHDMNFIRSLEMDCYALVQGRLRHVNGGVDQYLKSFK